VSPETAVAIAFVFPWVAYLLALALSRWL